MDRMLDHPSNGEEATPVATETTSPTDGEADGKADPISGPLVGEGLPFYHSGYHDDDHIVKECPEPSSPTEKFKKAFVTGDFGC